MRGAWSAHSRIHGHDRDNIVITVWRNRVANSDRNVSRETAARASVGATNLGTLTDEDLFALIPTEGSVTTPELARLTGKSVETVCRVLRRLISCGMVVAIGKRTSRQRRYVRH